MLGGVSEAEDVVPEALLRVHQALDAGQQIASPPASPGSASSGSPGAAGAAPPGT
jgi:hypothetical protein